MGLAVDQLGWLAHAGRSRAAGCGCGRVGVLRRPSRWRGLTGAARAALLALRKGNFPLVVYYRSGG